MFKSVRTMILILIAVIAIGLIPYFCVLYTSKATNLSNDTTIIINNDENIKVSELITFKPKMSQGYYIAIPSIFNIDNYKQIKNLTIYLNNEKLKHEQFWISSSKDIQIEEFDAVKDNIYQFTIDYEYDPANVADEYTNISTLTFNPRASFSKTNIKIILPQETNTFELSPNAKIEYLGNSTYNIKNIKNRRLSTLLIDTGVIKGADKINEELKISVQKENWKILYIMYVVSIIILVIVLILTRREKKKTEYVRNPSEVIEPILAESIIDKKIGAKELVMSCVVNLIYKGNLKNIGNDKIQLLNYNNLTELEKEILGLIFQDDNEIVTFDQIKKIFIKDNIKAKKISAKFKDIRKKIEKKLFDYNLYSRIGEYILRILKIISIAMILNSISMIFIILNYGRLPININIIYMCIINIIIAIFVSFNRIAYIISFIIFNPITIIFGTIFISILSKEALNNEIYIMNFPINEYIYVLILSVIILLLNIIIFKRTKLHVFTKTGQKEFAKAQGLKKYIIDYSLMKERDLESTIIWDEYLAYAVAFGIPNKIIEKFNEGLMNTNIIIQKIESILNF